MSYGGIDFGHVWTFQIRCMMSNQYGALVEAIGSGEINDIIVACLRLGWNDAFRHVSKNVKKFQELKDYAKETLIVDACRYVLDEFIEYMNKANTSERVDYLMKLFDENSNLPKKFAEIKIIDQMDSKYGEKALCPGHIQKMFNISIKLLLCLIISAEQAAEMNLAVKLGKSSDGNKDIYLTDNNWWNSEVFKPLRNDKLNVDCPLDSIILGEINNKIQNKKIVNIPNSGKKKSVAEITWSKLGTKEPISSYEIAQNAIREIHATTHNNVNCCNLLFDFENWNKNNL